MHDPDESLPERCRHFRLITSLRLDAELTGLEARLHNAHAARCADCRGYADELVAITARIRRTPVERP